MAIATADAPFPEPPDSPLPLTIFIFVSSFFKIKILDIKDTDPILKIIDLELVSPSLMRIKPSLLLLPPRIKLRRDSFHSPARLRPAGCFSRRNSWSLSTTLFVYFRSLTVVCRPWWQICSHIYTFGSASMLFVEPPLVKGLTNSDGSCVITSLLDQIRLYSNALIYSCLLHSASDCGWVFGEWLGLVLLELNIYIPIWIISADFDSPFDSTLPHFEDFTSGSLVSMIDISRISVRPITTIYTLCSLSFSYWVGTTLECGIGRCFKDPKLQMLLQDSANRMQVASVLIAEGLALKATLIATISSGFRSLICLSDSSLVTLINTKGVCIESKSLLYDIQCLSNDFTIISFVFISSLANCLPDALAKYILVMNNSSSMFGV